jgi:hypothetical protein
MTDRINFKNLCWFLFYLTAFFYLLYVSCERLDPDLGWHLQVGKEIVATKSVPTIEHFDYTLTGKTWVDHEWLSNAWLYYAYNHFGYICLNLFFALLMVSVLWLTNKYIRSYFIEKKYHGNLFFILLPLEILGLVAISPHAGVRLQEFSLLFLLLLLILLEKFSQQKKITPLLFIIPLLYFWSCSHGGFLIGIFLLFFLAGIKIVEKIIKRWRFFSFLDFSQEKNWQDIFIFLTIALITSASTLFTPYGLKLYSFLFDYRNNYYTAHISEWLPAWSFPFQYSQSFYLAIAFAIILIPLLQIFTPKRSIAPEKKLTLWQWGIFCLFLGLSFKSSRHFPLFFIATLPLLAKILTTELANMAIKSFTKNWLIKFYTLATFALVAIALIVKTNFTNEPFTNKKFCQAYPCAAINFLKNNPAGDKKIFNNYDWGGFMIWVWPEKQLFIDGRLPIYPYKDHTFLEEYHEFFDEKKVADKLAEHKIGLVLLKISPPIKVRIWEKFLFGVDEKKINSQVDYLAEYLQTAPNWEIVYQDNLSKVFLKK